VGAAEFMEYFDKGLLLNFPFLNKMKTAAMEFDRDERPSPTHGTIVGCGGGVAEGRSRGRGDRGRGGY
jgi:hypothetical protein